MIHCLNWNDESLRICTLPNSIFRFPIFFSQGEDTSTRKPQDLIKRYRETGMIRKLDNALVEERGRNFNPEVSSSYF